jgi:2-hydroxychromene-2-carboxylate isomerase
VAFEEINIRETPGTIEELLKKGVTATPALLFDEEMIIGFDRIKVDAAIARMR